MEEWRYTSTILDLGTRWRWIFNFTPRSLYRQGKSRSSHESKVFRVLNLISTAPWRRVGEWKYSSTIIDLDTRWRCVITFTPRPIYPWGRSPRYPLYRRLGGLCGVKENIAKCRGDLLDGILDWMMGFADTLYTQLGTTGNYSVTALLHTFQFTFTHALRSSVFTSRILATDLSVSL
jgi:hypothetical protein